MIDERDPAALTTYHVRRARAGDAASLAWVIRRFTPVLRSAASYRLGPALRPLYDADDIVQEVWAASIPRLADIRSREDRFTPVLMRFLGRTLLNHVKALARKHIRRGSAAARGGGGGEDDGGGIDIAAAVADEATAILDRLQREEEYRVAVACLDELEERDREIIILRGVEQHPYRVIAALLGEDPKILAVRYQRALEKLRRKLPGSVFEEFE